MFYRSTVIDGIASFFKLYDPLFGGQELHITADYPTCLGRPSVCGIEFIESYLQRIQAENDFLQLFPAQNVHVFLEKLVPGYAETPMNLFEPVFCRAAYLRHAQRIRPRLGRLTKRTRPPRALLFPIRLLSKRRF